MRVVVDTGIFGASLSGRRRVRSEPLVALMAGHQISLAAATVSELRYGALVAEWGDERRGSTSIASGMSRNTVIKAHAEVAAGSNRRSGCGHLVVVTSR